jgi:photosystem II stability/assembly factor-like uncharacterized protein
LYTLEEKMKKRTRIAYQMLSYCAALLIFAVPLFGQDQQIPTSNPHWSWQNPLPHGEKFGTASFVSSTEGWVVGEMQGAMHTTDGGATWTAQRFGPPLGFSGVAFRDRLNGCAVGNGSDEWGWNKDSIIWWTKDGGKTWQQKYFKQDGGGLGAVTFSTPQNAWAVGRYGTILKSSNGGKTWKKVTLPKDAEAYNFTDVAFADKRHGLVIGYNYAVVPTRNLFMLTKDGGAHWTPVHFNMGEGQSAQGFLWHVAFPTPLEGWAVGERGHIYHTSDGGQSWAKQNSPHEHALIDATDVIFHDSKKGFVTTSDGFILATSDGGENWTVSITQGQGLNALASFRAEHRFWALGKDGTGLRTDDFGATWEPLSESIREHLLGCSFVSRSIGWAVGTGATILRTQCGGLEWERVDSAVPSDVTLRGVFFVHASRGWVVGDQGTILTTDDGGETWSEQQSGTTEDLGAVYFIDTQRGWVGGGNGTLLRTRDGGNSWEPIHVSAEIDIHAIHFADPEHGWATGESVDRLLRTEDGGDTWTEVEVTFLWGQEVMGLYSLSFINALEGWACGGVKVGLGVTSVIAHTVDGGTTWHAQRINIGYHFSSLKKAL